MRILVLGAAGMLGHKLLQRVDADEVVGTVRTRAQADLAQAVRPAPIEILDARDAEAVRALLDRVAPDVVLNAIGVVKQRGGVGDETMVQVNEALPQHLAAWVRERDARLIHFGTDCVFAGTRGGYTEADPPDAEDLYGRSKHRGEVGGARCLTLRTSIVGRELGTTQGLVEWFLSQRGGEVKGYTHAVFSGLPTLVLADTVGRVVHEHGGLEGVYHVAAAPIAKLDLLRLLDAAYGTGTTIVPDDTVRIDRSLDGTRFREATGISFPAWEALVRTMAEDPTPYEEIRRVRT